MQAVRRSNRRCGVDSGLGDVTVRRWQDHTKKQATLAQDGRPYAVVAAERAQGLADRAQRPGGAAVA